MFLEVLERKPPTNSSEGAKDEVAFMCKNKHRRKTVRKLLLSSLFAAGVGIGIAQAKLSSKSPHRGQEWSTVALVQAGSISGLGDITSGTVRLTLGSRGAGQFRHVRTRSGLLPNGNTATMGNVLVEGTGGSGAPKLLLLGGICG